MLQHKLQHSQNFLHSRGLVSHLVDLASLRPEDIIYEIGPGRGIITDELARRCRKVVAIEKDAALVERLIDKYKNNDHISIMQGDFLHVDLPRGPYKMFSNIPFDHTAAIMKKITSESKHLQAAYLVMQREAADRYMGGEVETLRSVLLKPWFELSVLYRFRRQDFHPVPAVDSALVSIIKRMKPLIDAQERCGFGNFIVYCFSSSQTGLLEALKKICSRGQVRRLKEIIEPGQYPSQVSLTTWLELYRIYSNGITAKGAAILDGRARRLENEQSRLEKRYRTRETATSLRARQAEKTR